MRGLETVGMKRGQTERNIDKLTSRLYENLMRSQFSTSRLQAQTLPDAAPPVGKIYPFRKIGITFEPIQQFYALQDLESLNVKKMSI